MTLLTKNILYFVMLTALVAGIFPSSVLGQSKEELKSVIDAKSNELKNINNQIQENQKKLQETLNQKQSISSEIKVIDSNIKQINLGIQSSKVVIDKLDLEIKSTQQDIGEAESELSQKEVALTEVLREIQKNDSENMILILFKNRTLSDSVLEMQSLQNVNSDLLIKIDEVNQSKNKLEKYLATAASTKDNKEVEYVNLQSKKSIADDLKQTKNKFLEQTKNKEKVYAESIKELEKRQLEIASEIEKMEAELRSQINYKNLPKNLPGFLALPVVGGLLTQEYGSTKFAQRAYKGKWHNGVDLAAPIGTPIYAASDGIVTAIDNQDLYCRKGAYGKYVAIRHFMGLTTLYAHLSTYIVKEGDQVKKGQVIGYVGNTGYATGPHLHFTVYDTETFKTGPSNSCGPKMPYGGDLNPLNYLAL